MCFFLFSTLVNICALICTDNLLIYDQRYMTFNAVDKVNTEEFLVVEQKATSIPPT